jgi:hypothetical protein
MFPLFIFFSVALAGRFETHNSRSFDRQAVERSSVKADLHVTGRVGVASQAHFNNLHLFLFLKKC